MLALVIQHEKSTPPGTVIDYFKINHISFHILKIHEGDQFDTNLNFDLLVICGGSMNVDQEHIHPWLKAEKKLITKAIQNKKKIIGLCLGAQLIAECLGGEVQPMNYTESGWQKIRLTNTKQIKFLKESLSVFQFHSYCFLNIPNVDYFATNDACLNQGFTYNDQIVAFQFHPESTKEWIITCSEEKDLATGPYCQNKIDMVLGLNQQNEMRLWFFNLLDQFLMTSNR